MNAAVASPKKCAQRPAHETDQNRTPKCASEIVDVKAVYEVVYQEEEKAVYDEDENPERENDQRRHEEKQNGAQESVQDPEKERGADKRGDAVITNSADDGGGHHHSYGGDRPSKNKVPHR